MGTFEVAHLIVALTGANLLIIAIGAWKIASRLAVLEVTLESQSVNVGVQLGRMVADIEKLDTDLEEAWKVLHRLDKAVEA